MSKSISQRDTILTINTVEPALVEAVKLHSQQMGQELKGLALISKTYADSPQSDHTAKDQSGFFKEIICDFDNSSAMQKTLKSYANHILAVQCRHEPAISDFRKVLPFLPYVYTPSEAALLWCTEKQLMRDRLHTYDSALVPKYQYLEEDDLPELEELIKDFEFPVIVKPAGLSKSLLVTDCYNMAELTKCLTNTFKVIDIIYAREHRQQKPSVLVEEMMQGDMYSTDAYVTHDGEIYCLPLVRVITAHEVGQPGFYSYRHIIPVGLPQKEIEGAFTASKSAVKALNLSSVTAHIELFRTAQGWKIIEVGPRIGGYRQDLYQQAYGIDHFYNDLCVRMGLKPKMPGAPIKHAAGINIYANKEGHIEAIEGIEEARNLSSVVYLETHAKKGDLALFAGNGGDLIVDGILSNTNPAQLERDVAKVRELVKIRLQKKAVVASSPYLRTLQPHARRGHKRPNAHTVAKY